jgi:hypothetical protein
VVLLLLLLTRQLALAPEVGVAVAGVEGREDAHLRRPPKATTYTSASIRPAQRRARVVDAAPLWTPSSSHPLLLQCNQHHLLREDNAVGANTVSRPNPVRIFHQSMSSCWVMPLLLMVMMSWTKWRQKLKQSGANKVTLHRLMPMLC